MTILNNGKNIYLKQGDTGNITFKGIPTDKNYSVFMSIYNEDTNTILKEITATSVIGDTALFAIGEDESNSLPVGDWVYALKICADGSEDTVIPLVRVENGTIIKDNAPEFTVDYKYVEGE